MPITTAASSVDFVAVLDDLLVVRALLYHQFGLGRVELVVRVVPRLNLEINESTSSHLRQLLSYLASSPDLVHDVCRYGHNGSNTENVPPVG